MKNEPAIWRDGCLLNYATCDKDENGQPIPSKEEHLKKMNIVIAFNNLMEALGPDITNGDMINAIFPDLAEYLFLNVFEEEWWDSPYRKEQE